MLAGISDFNSDSAQQHTPAAVSRQSQVALAEHCLFRNRLENAVAAKFRYARP
jgi:hypothetical protein